MAERAWPPLGGRGGAQRPGLRLGALPRWRRPCRGPGGLVTPEYRWPQWNAQPSGAPALHGSCRATRPRGRPAEPPPRPRLASLGPARVPAARGPSSAEGAVLPAGRRPLPSLSSRRRKAESEGAPVKPFAPHAEVPGPRGGSALGDDAEDDTWACGAVG